MVLALGPVGCGFKPIYGRSGGQASSPMADELASVAVEGIEDRIGQQLRNNLVLALSPRGEPASPRYSLKVQLSESQSGLANSRDGNATVGRVMVSASYVLSDTVKERTLYSGTARAFGGYRLLGPRYASTVAERDAETSVLTEIAAEIRSALAAYFSDPATFAQRQQQMNGRMLQPLPPLQPLATP